MATHPRHTLIIFIALVVILQISEGQLQTTPESEAENHNYSSSDKSLEDSNESRNRYRRSTETSVEEVDTGAGKSKAASLPGLPNIPGLANPEAIMKIAEILTTIGQQVLPILVSGNSRASDFVTNRVSHDIKLLNELLTGDLRKSK